MPVAVSPERPRTGVTRITGALVAKESELVQEDVWISSITGKILNSQEVFYEHHVIPDKVIDLRGKILTPGFIDVQFNGGFGFDFSTVPCDDPGMAEYQKGMTNLNKKLIQTGVTSYLPTLPSQQPHVYHKVLPYLGPSGRPRDSFAGSESLGAHCEGPFISPSKNGIHSPLVLREATLGFADLEACYGEDNMSDCDPSPVSMITAAPEVAGIESTIAEVTRRGIRFAIGHTEATYEEAANAVQQGATMITHLFNAMRPLHHRNPGVFGMLGKAEGKDRPFFGVISDGIHLHPNTIKIAWNSHPEGMILVSDAMKTVGLPDGLYNWTNGDRWEKKGPLLVREGTDTIAGSSATLLECASNFWSWTHASIPDVIRAVTTAPAKMLGIEHVKGSVRPDADADLVALDAIESDGTREFRISKVWKFGSLVHEQ